ncbi:hypothetical protein BG011_008371 [Mortierella polycephala]|uniref:FAD-binding domain-containing protein n=1 Tax=Mortierella polycephala TaxID=41804 RepID=A0A9P6U8F1_9FUNG|nr:hypothetical protein BG011_008371 [Mortierella polycephala]
MTTATAVADLKVIIVGSSIGGLAAAIGLELAGFDYTIIEQPPLHEPASKSDTDSTPSNAFYIGGAVQLAPTALHFLHQLGIYEEIQKISKPVSGFSMNEHDMNYVGRIDLAAHRERYGYHTEVMAWSQLHALLLQRIPSRRIVRGKVLGMMQDHEKVTVRCSDGTTYEGHILIAADGAFSNIRHSLYWTLDEKKQLPRADVAPMSVDLHIISGCTKPLDSTKYPVLLDTMSEIQSVQTPDKPYTIWFVPLLDNRIAWDITREVTKTAIRQGEAPRVYSWRPEDVEETLDAVKDCLCPYGGQISDLLETTEQDSMYFHMTEERFCETWYGGRTVLLGDACHRGFYQPVSEAIIDAVTLVNLLANMQSDSLDSLTAAFKEYRDCRAPSAKAAVEQCVQTRQVFSGKGRAASLKRNVVFNYMPEKVRNMLDDKRHENRPQLWFIPTVKDRGLVRPIPNPPLGSTANIGEESLQESHSDGTGAAVGRSSSSSSSSPRNSRTSWSSISRPAFSMPSAPSVSLFTSSTSAIPRVASSKRTSSVKSPRVSVIRSSKEGEQESTWSSFAPQATSIAAASSTAVATTIVVDAESSTGDVASFNCNPNTMDQTPPVTGTSLDKQAEKQKENEGATIAAVAV